MTLLQLAFHVSNLKKQLWYNISSKIQRHENIFSLKHLYAFKISLHAIVTQTTDVLSHTLHFYYVYIFYKNKNITCYKYAIPNQFYSPFSSLFLFSSIDRFICL